MAAVICRDSAQSWTLADTFGPHSLGVMLLILNLPAHLIRGVDVIRTEFCTAHAAHAILSAPPDAAHVVISAPPNAAQCKYYIVTLYSTHWRNADYEGEDQRN